MKRGSVLIDESDASQAPRVLFYLEHSIQDGRVSPNGTRRVISRQLQFVEMPPDGSVRMGGPAPYLDYRPATEEERKMALDAAGKSWLTSDLERAALDYAVEHVVPQHLSHVSNLKAEQVTKTMAAVKDRLTKEITYWDRRANELKASELAGRGSSRLNSGKARQRADDLQARLERRMRELEEECRVSASAPLVAGRHARYPRRSPGEAQGRRWRTARHLCRR